MQCKIHFHPTQGLFIVLCLISFLYNNFLVLMYLFFPPHPGSVNYSKHTCVEPKCNFPLIIFCLCSNLRWKHCIFCNNNKIMKMFVQDKCCLLKYQSWATKHSQVSTNWFISKSHLHWESFESLDAHLIPIGNEKLRSVFIFAIA